MPRELRHYYPHSKMPVCAQLWQWTTGLPRLCLGPSGWMGTLCPLQTNREREVYLGLLPCPFPKGASLSPRSLFPNSSPSLPTSHAINSPETSHCFPRNTLHSLFCLLKKKKKNLLLNFVIFKAKHQILHLASGSSGCSEWVNTESRALPPLKRPVSEHVKACQEDGRT